MSRPLSPHLQIYKPQLTSVLSMTHRLTGIALAVSTLALTYWLIAVAAGDQSYQQALGHFSSWYGQIALMGWTLAFYYHLCNGIRHLAWDSGYGFELPTVYRTGWLVVLTSIILTGLTWFLVFILRGTTL